MRLSALFALLALLVVGLAVPAAADAREPVTEVQRGGCYNFGCADKLPENTNCDADPYIQTVTSRDGYSGDGRVQVCYSPLCHAYWGRYDPQGSLPSCYESRIQIQVGVRNSSGGIDPVNSQSRNGDKCSWYWTRMLGAGDRWARVRSGYLLCSFQDPCDVAWTGWSAWGKF